MPLYMLAADHRGWLLRALAAELPRTSDETATLARRVKQLCFEAVVAAVEHGVARADAALLIDEELGAEVAVRAQEAGLTVAMPIEKPDQEVFQPEYGESWLEHVVAMDPDLPKVLIRHNPSTNRSDLEEQLRRVRQVSDTLHRAGRPLMLELLVPPTPAQLEDAGGDQRVFDECWRADLTVGAVREILAAGVRVEIWKVEGMTTRAQAALLARACQSGGPSRCIVLGRNAGWEQVERWLGNAAASPGYDGFAIGRTLWFDTAVEFFRGSLSWGEAVSRVADAYRRAVDVYESRGEGGPVPSDLGNAGRGSSVRFGMDPGAGSGGEIG